MQMVLLDFVKKLKYRFFQLMLKNTHSDEFERLSHQKALEAFQKAASVSFYNRLLMEKNVNPLDICDLESFKKNVPVLKKDLLFKEPNFSEWLKDIPYEKIQSILLSSGSTGAFSFGLNTFEDSKKDGHVIEFFFQTYFNILNKKTLIINALSVVDIPSMGAVSVHTGPRTDSVLYLLKTTAPYFDQTIIIGDNFFIKNTIDDGVKEKMDFTKITLHLIMGGQYFPESLRSYLLDILGNKKQDPTKSQIFSSMGISEFGLNIFFENTHTIQLRKLFIANLDFKKTLLEEDKLPDFTPMVFQFVPSSFYIEDLNDELVITNLNTHHPFPFVRYNTQDVGKLIPYQKLKKALIEMKAPEMVPPIQSPLVLVYGKSDGLNSSGGKIYSARIEEILFSDSQIAGCITGNFRLHEHNAAGRLELQLKKDMHLSDQLKTYIEQSIQKQIQTHIPIIIHPYASFPYGMELDYERKFKFV